MREIKFRAWNGKVMTYPKTVELGISGVNGLPSLSYQLDGGGYCTTSHGMQYTGLKDKNLVEIYEEDNVRFKDHRGIERIGIVSWVRDAYGVDYADELGLFGKNSVYLSTFKLEVIGNIYENPELLSD